MRLSDAALGVVLLGAAAAIAWTARGFPLVPGQAFGPSLFPMLIAAGFAACGAGLIVRDMRAGLRMPWLALGPLLGEARARVDALLLLGAIVFYLAAAPRLGFVPTAAAVLLVLVRRFGASWSLAVATALLGPIVLHLLFAEWLRVPLPLGLIASIRY
ncbi:MAG: tripartite tricarboxylate transporter TctB family protein [Elioraea sp.]|nr:tripartite tricarboxylate transporter TctB family protein [Elioraea sp.]